MGSPVISINSGTIKVGFAGDDVPIILIPNIITRDKHGNIVGIGHETKDTLNMYISSPVISLIGMD